jgi:3-deoxy-D-manno-octulosonic-acid transferase
MYLLAAALAAPFWLRKRRDDWSARCGKTERLPDADRPRVMLHAVSVGEVNALRHLVPLLTPNVEVVVTTTTDTGMARARSLFAETCRVLRYPLDASWMVKRFLDAVRPDAVALVELELWPTFVETCSARGIPVCVINGRLSARSFKGYNRFRRLMSPSFEKLAFAAVQDEAYAERFEAMGVAPERCLLTGSMKWDAVSGEVEGADELAAEFGIDRDRPLIVAGSTGPGEEALLHEACPEGVQLVCATRKPERFDEAERAMPGCVRRSSGTRAPGGATRFLLDTIGELRAAYALGDVCVVGRSFGDLYGSDPLEPAALGKPVVIGPAYSDFAQPVAALRADDAIIVAERDQLPDVLVRLLDDAPRRAVLGANARACVGANRGASERHAELLLDLAGVNVEGAILDADSESGAADSTKGRTRAFED